jgi:hypothetical protein
MDADDIRQIRSSGGAMAGRRIPDQLTAALINLSLRTVRRVEDEKDHHARMELFLVDLRKWPLDVALEALQRWPEESSYWPSWHELTQAMNVAINERRLSLPKPRGLPEHQPLRRGNVREFEPFKTRGEWDEFAEAMRDLRDKAKPMLCREALLKMGENIEARQRPHAERQGWA